MNKKRESMVAFLAEHALDAETVEDMFNALEMFFTEKDAIDGETGRFLWNSSITENARQSLERARRRIEVTKDYFKY